MATRQQTRTTRKSGSKSSAGNESDGTQESAVLRAGFNPTSFDDSPTPASEGTDTPRVKFIGDQIVFGDRKTRIAEAAYLRAERRGFHPGYELEDWLAAEREIDAELSGDRSRQ